MRDGPEGPALEKLICLALIRYCLNRVVYVRSQACIFHTLSLELFDKLPYTATPLCRYERRAFLWVYMMVIDSWAQWTLKISDEAARLLYMMDQAFPETRSWSSADFDHFGQEFLWTENISCILQRYCEQRDARSKCRVQLAFR
jgi:hypothetical protein